MNMFIRNHFLPAMLLAVGLLHGCSKPDTENCPDCDTVETLDAVDDLAGYMSRDRRVLFVAPGNRNSALQALNAQSVGDGLYEASLKPLYGVPFSFRFSVVDTDYPYLFLGLDEGWYAGPDEAVDAIKGRVKTATDADVEAAIEAAAAAAAARAAIAAADEHGNGGKGEPKEEPVGGVNEVLYDEVKGVAVWKNARCGSPIEPARVTACQGPIPADGEELAGLYWRSTFYGKAKCVKGNGICTEIRQAGGYIEFAADNQCSIVQDVRPLDTNLYCQQ